MLLDQRVAKLLAPHGAELLAPHSAELLAPHGIVGAIHASRRQPHDDKPRDGGSHRIDGALLPEVEKPQFFSVRGEIAGVQLLPAADENVLRLALRILAQVLRMNTNHDHVHLEDCLYSVLFSWSLLCLPCFVRNLMLGTTK